MIDAPSAALQSGTNENILFFLNNHNPLMFPYVHSCSFTDADFVGIFLLVSVGTLSEPFSARSRKAEAGTSLQRPILIVLSFPSPINL